MTKKLKKYLPILLLIFGLLIGFGSAITLIQLTPERLGFATQQIIDSDIRVIAMEHSIEEVNEIKTEITLQNAGSSTHTADVILSYKSYSGGLLASPKLTITLNGGQQQRYTIIVNLDVSAWASVDISIQQTL